MSQMVREPSTFLSVSVSVRRVFLVNPGPLTTTRVAQLVAEVRRKPQTEEMDAAVVAVLFHLVARKEVTAQATHTQTLWSAVKGPIKHGCFGCECYEGVEDVFKKVPCIDCVADCDACYTAQQANPECIHNGVFASREGNHSWCAHCQRWVPASDL